MAEFDKMGIVINEIGGEMKDKRNKFWATLELRIQKNAGKKDKKFILSGPWKRFIGMKDSFLIYAVDGEWVRNNLSVTFEHGGHGFVYEFIPVSEIWAATHHPQDCRCKKVKPDREMSNRCFDSTVVHEIAEFRKMKNGMPYWPAHRIALKEERKAGILNDPYTENYD